MLYKILLKLFLKNHIIRKIICPIDQKSNYLKISDLQTPHVWNNVYINICIDIYIYTDIVDIAHMLARDSTKTERIFHHVTVFNALAIHQMRYHYQNTRRASCTHIWCAVRVLRALIVHKAQREKSIQVFIQAVVSSHTPHNDCSLCRVASRASNACIICEFVIGFWVRFYRKIH